jgi:hypothetical protein
MRVVVRFSEVVHASVAAWRARLAADPQIRDQLAAAYLDELKQRLVKAGGIPKGALVEPWLEPPRYWYELTGGTWVGYTVVLTGRLFGRREVLITELVTGPPPGAVPAAPPS